MQTVDASGEAAATILVCDGARAVVHGALFQHAPVGMAQTSLDGRICDANAQLCAMLGYSAEELRALSTGELTHPDDRGRSTGLREQLLDGRIGSYRVQKRFARKDGRWLWIERNVTLAHDAANEPPYLIQVFQDVTERKRTEAQLERLRRARELLARCNRALMHASVESHLLNEVCRIAVDAGGFKQAWIGLATGESKRGVQVAAHAGYERYRPPMSSAAMWTADGRYRGKMAEVVRTGALRIERDVLGEERDNFQRDHARRLGWGSSAAFALATDGCVLGAIEFNAREVDAFDSDEIALLSELAADLSFGIGALRTRRARAEAEARIHAQERRYQETFDKAPVGIMHTAFEDNQILRANRRLAEMLGYTEAELLQLKSTDLVHPSMRGNDGPRYRQRLVEGDSETHASERLYLHKQGWTIWVNRTVSLVKDAAGKPDYYIRIIEDISERILSVRRRAMEHAVAKALAEATSMEEAMPALIRTMCEACDWCYGAHWCWSNAESKLVRSAYWSDCELRFADAEEERRWIRLYLRNQSGLVGGAWHEGRPQWIQDMQANTAFQRRYTALRFGFHSALSFPIIAGAETIGSMEFFAREVRKPDEVLLQTVGSIGRQIGQFIQRKQAEQARRESEERYRDIFESSPLPMWVRDDQTRAIITVNQAAIDHYGYSREEFLGMTVRDLWDPAEQATYEEDGRSSPDMQILHLKRRHLTKDGRVRDVEATARAFELSGRRVWLTLINDVTERVRAEQKLVHLAHYDPLTGLPNRVLFNERLKQALKLGARNRWITAVMFMDIDRFKNVNDTLGHDIGDQLLREVSQRLAASVRASDTVGRLGGDEFAVVLSNVASREDVGHVAQKIMQNFHAPFRLSGSEIFVTTSIGITLAPQDGAEQETLLKNADSAMYKAKEMGRNTFRFYTPEMSARASRLLTLEGSLRRALERNEFLLHYQPKACVASRTITGVEALLRWRHPERGLVAPGEFIPVLEETGLIVQAAEWVLNAVCIQLLQWRADGVRQVPVAVNLSAREFLAPDLGRTIRRILETHAVSPSLLELEITESSLMVNPQEAASTLEYLKQLGVGLSIDDFGTGYSSLSYLKRFPLDALKIDRSFVRDITANANDAAITLAIISMAHSLGLKVVAEGVEEPAQLAFLAQHGCDQVQGFLLARPLDALACARILQTGRLGAASD